MRGFGDRKGKLATLVIIALFLAGCGVLSPVSQTKPIQQWGYTVDPIFFDLYRYMGGEQVVGPALNSPFQIGDRVRQYFLTVIMEWDPAAPVAAQHHLVPLGLEMVASDPAAEPHEPGSGDLFICNHNIYNKFVALYTRIGGERFAGCPITEMRFNPDPNKRRFEQYFENVGFYLREGDSDEHVHMLYYGLWHLCQENSDCGITPTNNSGLIETGNGRPAVQFQDNPFGVVASRLGSDFTGLAISSPYTDRNGKRKQIYEGVVLQEDSNNPAGISLLELPAWVGILPEEPRPGSGMDGMFFYAIQGKLGYDVPVEFMDYLQLHGGMEISGAPITHLNMTSDQVYRQCFTNFCLDYLLSAPEGQRITLSPLGKDYKSKYYLPPSENFTDPQAKHAISMQVWERYPFVESSQSQEIGVSILEDTVPLSSVSPVLIVTLPDGQQKTYTFPPTGTDGRTSITLDPIDAPLGRLIPYSVCISSEEMEQFCVRKGFVIWYNP